jgi:sigma-B regulation protein RsbU (phosphoserine phosphatase)
MAPRFSERALRRILLLLAVAACLYEAGVAWTLWRYVAVPHTEARWPFEMEFRYPRIGRRVSDSLHVLQVAMFLKQGAAYAPAYSLGLNGNSPIPDAARLVAHIGRSDEPQPVYAEDPASWIHESSGEERRPLAGMQTQLLLPLRARQDLLGFVSLGPKLSEEPYPGSDIRLLKSVAAQTGLALENSRLTAQVAHEAARRESEQREMKIARDVQQRLFPHRFPKIEGIEYAGACRPAQTVGGDYYDFVEAPGGEFGIAIGDVSGKGVPAALLMAGLVAALRGQAMNAFKDLAALMGNVNRLIYDASPKSHFATLFYAQFDPATRTLRYANAGHNPPMLIRASGEVELLMPGGPGIGMSPRSKYRAAELRLAPGDVPVAYTDGFSEAMNPARKEFGDQRLKEAALAARALAPEAAIPALMNAVHRFAAEAPQADDMTMVVVKVL